MEKAINSIIRALNHSDAGAPEWLHLLPATEFKGVDGRGPWAAPDMDALISTFNKEGGRVAVDENHSTDLAAKQGHSAPARGWIVELEKRDDGLYGRVEWTPEGERMVAAKEYGFLSPVLLHTLQKPYRILKVARVSLTNDPNISHLKSLHSTEETAMLEQLRKALGLPETADEATILAAVATAHTAQAGAAALMARIAEAAGVARDTAPDALVTAIHSRGKATATEAENAELKTQLTSLQSQLTALATTTAKDKAEAAIDGAIEAGKIVPALRDHMITRHMKNPAEVESEIKLMPSLNAGGLGGRKQPGADDNALTAEDNEVMAMMGIDPKAYADTAKALHGKGN
ncbi:Mu-like prophage I protein [Rhizobium phaseoli]|uniref:phage protease n=1 Tax=Rhizobium phaseoli TaxID=396 RepID=UPI0007E9FCDD|nr:phage protease [Rhizobium phaseoli]ANM05237.1 Mu-like prophage I protein [Rhizobium phaseoli]